MDTNQTVAKKSKQFAIHVMKLVEHLRKNKRPYFIIDQVGRSGTSIGANVMEAEHAITQKEFLQKMYIAYKESNETLYWLELLFESGYVAPEGYQRLYTECNEIEKNAVCDYQNDGRKNKKKRRFIIFAPYHHSSLLTPHF